MVGFRRRPGGLFGVFATGSVLALAGGCGEEFHAAPSEDTAGESGESSGGGKGGSAGANGGSRAGGAGAGRTGGDASGTTGDAGEPATSGGAGRSSGNAGDAGSRTTGGNGGNGGDTEGGAAGVAGTDTEGGAAGTPDPACEAPKLECGDACVDLDTSTEHCGACDYACVHGRACVGGRCTPAWQPLELTGAPLPRTGHAAGFVAGKYVVFGGSTTGLGEALNDAASYDVTNDTWAVTGSLNHARCAHAGASTGSAIYAYGGLGNCGDPATVGPGLERFSPNSSGGAWTVVTPNGEAPTPRYDTSAAWLGAQLLVFGGSSATRPSLRYGANYEQAIDFWGDSSCPLVHCDRSAGVLFADADGARFFGGSYNQNDPDPPTSMTEATLGLSYDLQAGSWSFWPYPEGTAERLARRYVDDGKRLYFLKAADVVTIYDKKSSSWLESDMASMPLGFCTDAAAAWTGAELVAWSGNCGAGSVPVGGRYQPVAAKE